MTGKQIAGYVDLVIVRGLGLILFVTMLPFSAIAEVIESGDFFELTDITCDYPNSDDRYEGLGYVELQGFRVYIDYCSNSQQNEDTIFNISRALLLIDK
ncbi:MAG: hypothetical protein OXG05_10575 [Gammaproteobacteria bacterium]|nr:hypothetical protein [Gammaproteobacteria bacterium]